MERERLGLIAEATINGLVVVLGVAKGFIELVATAEILFSYSRRNALIPKPFEVIED